MSFRRCLYCGDNHKDEECPKRAGKSVPPTDRQNKRLIVWSPEEDKAMRDGICTYGLGKWKNIIEDKERGMVFLGKSNMDLSNRWRSLMQSNRTPVPKNYKTDPLLLAQVIRDSLQALDNIIQDPNFVKKKYNPKVRASVGGSRRTAARAKKAKKAAKKHQTLPSAGTQYVRVAPQHVGYSAYQPVHQSQQRTELSTPLMYHNTNADSSGADDGYSSDEDRNDRFDLDKKLESEKFMFYYDNKEQLVRLSGKDDTLKVFPSLKRLKRYLHLTLGVSEADTMHLLSTISDPNTTPTARRRILSDYLYDHALTNPDAAGQARRMQVASSRVHPRTVTMQQPPPVAPFRSTRKHAALSSALQEGHSVKRMWKNVHSGHRKRNQTHRGGHMTERPYSDLYLKSYADAQRVQARVNYTLPVKKFKSNSSTKYK